MEQSEKQYQTPAKGTAMPLQAGWLSFDSKTANAIPAIFGIFHQACIESLDTITLILPPIGPEYMHCHRTLKALAQALSRRGIASVRLDYANYGNSGDTTSGAHALDYNMCVQGVVQAISCVKEQNPHKKISLVALRSASLIVSEVLSKVTVDSLIYWYPYLNGAGFIRDMQLIDTQLKLKPNKNGIEAGGYPIGFGDCELIKGIKLAGVDHASVASCLLAVNGEQKSNTRLKDTLNKQGIRCEQIECFGLAQMARQAELSIVPEENLEQIAQWLESKYHSDTQVSQLSLEVDLQAKDYREYVQRFNGPSLNIFGVVTLPSYAESVAQCDKVVILGNAGSGHHVGPNRLHVFLARKLAKDNIATVRIDVSGLGETPSHESEPDSNAHNDAHPYPSSAVECSIIVAKKMGEQGVNNLVLAGLCSGAYHAFHAALICDIWPKNMHLEKICLINPLFFYWKAGESIFAPQSQSEELSRRYYADQAKDPKKWLVMLLNPKKWKNVLVFGWQFMIKKTVDMLNKLRNIFFGEKLSRLSIDMNRILTRNTRVVLLMAEGEPGLLVLESDLDETVMRHKNFAMKRFEKTDHTFSAMRARDELLESLSVEIRG